MKQLTSSILVSLLIVVVVALMTSVPASASVAPGSAFGIHWHGNIP